MYRNSNVNQHRSRGRPAGLLLAALVWAGSCTAQAAGDSSGGQLLPPAEEARRMAAMMGGADAIRTASANSIRAGSAEDCAWGLRLTDILLALDPADRQAQDLRAGARQCLEGQADSSSSMNGELAVGGALEPAAPERLDAGAPVQTEHGVQHATMTHGDPWNVVQNVFSVAVADANWTINEDFPGTKLIFDGRYAIRRTIVEPESTNCDCVVKPPKTRVVGALRAHLQWGEGESGLEYGRVSLSALADQRDYPPDPGRFTAVRDMYEWGVVQGGKDDPLGVNYYGELVLARFARTWARAPKSSPWWFILGLEGSIGYSWSESDNERYEEVSNPIIGSSLRASINRSGMGSLYLQQRVINGFGFSSPARSGAVSREARFRFGYLHRFQNCLALDLFVEKRSFNFSDPQLPDLYTKSKRTGLALGCTF